MASFRQAALEGENDDDTRDDAVVLFGNDLGDGYAPIDMDDGGGERATVTGTIVGSTSSTLYSLHIGFRSRLGHDCTYQGVIN